MAKKHAFLLPGLITISALGTLFLLLTAPSWSSSKQLFVTSSAPENLPTTGTDLTLHGGGFSPTTHLWLVPERSLRSVTTATLETYGNPHHFIRRNNNLYVANGVGGFLIVQGVQSPVPFISGILDSEGQGMEIVLHQDVALLAAGASGLQIIDIRDDTNPQLLAALKSVAPALSVASSGKIAYIAAAKAGVQIVDLTDPRQPRRLGKLADIPEAYKLSCDGKILIVATASGGWLYDISQPEQPRRLAALPVPAGMNTVMTRRGETLYWATKTSQESRLYSFDLGRPTSPRLLASVPLNGTPFGISCSEDQLAITLGSSGTQLFSLDSGPQLIAGAMIAAKSRTHYALLFGRDLWVGDSDGELLRLDQQKASALTTAPILPDFSPLIIPIITPHLILLGDKNGLSVYDRGGATTPILLARLPITGLEQQYLSTDQRQLWLASRDDAPATTGRLILVDISRPHAPRITAEIPLSHRPNIFGEQGTTLVISTPTPDQERPLNQADRLDSLHFVDISLPQNPVLASSYPLANICAGLSITEHFIVLMQTGGLLRVLNISAAGAPQEVGSLQMPWLHMADWAGRVNIVVKDKVAFVSSPLGRIVLIDLHDPEQPKLLGGFNLAGPVRSLVISDHLLLAEVKKEGMVVIDLKKIREPEILGTIPLPGVFHHSTVQGGSFWYTCAYSNGIWSFPLPRRLQSSVAGDKIVASIEQQPPPGAYRLWLSDEQSHLLVPGVSWSSPQL